jgi:hypothetical protein
MDINRRFPTLWVVLLSVCLLSLPAAAQRQGGGGAGGSGGRGSQQPQMGDQRPQSPREQTPPAQPRGTADQDRSQTRVDVSGAQRGQYTACDGTADQLRQHIQQMQKSTSDLAQMKLDRDRLRDMIQDLDRQFTEFRQGLSKDQAQQLQGRLETLERERDQLRTHQQSLDAELDSPNPVEQRLIDRTREVEQAMERWQTEYGKLGVDIGASRN